MRICDKAYQKVSFSVALLAILPLTCVASVTWGSVLAVVVWHVLFIDQPVQIYQGNLLNLHIFATGRQDVGAAFLIS